MMVSYKVLLSLLAIEWMKAINSGEMYGKEKGVKKEMFL